ncbi:MAG: hypothetical protein E6357_30715 [Clostridiales bacterium]|nr:hypothetical protein [Clostridiales bacterium]
MNAKDIAKSYFSRITCGHRNTVLRPDLSTDLSQRIDRELRRLVEKANHDGDCIINIGNGYYRPIPTDPVDALEYKQYKMEGHSRINKLTLKEESMDMAFNNWAKEAGVEIGRMDKTAS